ncbi:MAG TPA: carboxypeptidase-like regulatory domain-containing protein [Pyrinomonadaceae bacterium]|nr:carboxypeptidase-like regulatory domain-containing protein [Pyrinomonadaceae bacterium]
MKSTLVTIAKTLLLASLVLCWTIDGKPQTEDKPNGSTVRGLVVYSDTGRPLRHASVNLVNNDNGAYQGHAVTNGRGQFVLEHVTAGRYILFTDLPGILLPANFERNMAPVNSQLRLNAKRDLFTEVVVNGSESVDVKIQAVRGGVITGRVVTEDDQPVPNADIKLLKRENDKWRPDPVTWRGASEEQRPKTDASGGYRIAGLEAGDYIVRVSEPTIGFDRFVHADDAYSDGRLMVAYYPSATNIKEAQAVSVVEGNESTGVDIRLPERIPRTISGNVTYGPDDAPAASIEILIEPADESGFLSDFNTTVRADSKGNWVVPGIPAGNYVVRFSGTVFVLAESAARRVYMAPKRVPVTVANEDVIVNTRVELGAMVSGTIKFEGPVPDSVQDLNLSVVLAAEGSERSLNNPKRGYLRDSSKFEIRELAGGKYWFVISGFDPDLYYVKSVTRKGVDLAQGPFTLATGAEFGDVLVTFGADVATIEGQVSNLKPKTSAADIVVMLAPANDATRRFSRGLLTVHPDAQGKFVFTCGPGEYFVAAFTRAQLAKLTTPITEGYFKQDNGASARQKFQRVKVRAAEKLKGLTLSIGVD